MRTYDHIFNWPNILTIIRILVIPLLVVCYYLPFAWAHIAAAVIFAFASFTDWVDGYLARYLQQTTKLGAFLDPVADKLMVSIALVMIVAEPTFQFIGIKSSIVSIPAVFITVPAAIIVAREIIVSALREWMAELGKRSSVKVNTLGKVKTTVQMIALIVLLTCDTSSSTFVILLGYVLLYIAAVLTIWSMFLYLKAAFSEINLE